jgi:hypothetical protein
MSLSQIITISGKPGLYKSIGQNKNSLIVESLIDGKKIPVYAAHKISALEDISIYTYDTDIPLTQVFQAIYKKENGGECISHKSAGGELKNYMKEVLPDYDEDRVYTSDIKKIFNWYNQLHGHGMLEAEAADLSTTEEKEETTSPEAGE